MGSDPDLVLPPSRIGGANYFIEIGAIFRNRQQLFNPHPIFLHFFYEQPEGQSSSIAADYRASDLLPEPLPPIPHYPSPTTMTTNFLLNICAKRFGVR